MASPSQSLSGKTALVTGARGIGAAVARALAADGADVAIGYSTSVLKAEALVRELKSLGARAIAFPADQSKPAQAARLIRQVIDTFGRLDILVNDAGVATPLSGAANRFATSEDIASAVAHLASPGALCATGTVPTVDGGLTA